MSVPNPLNRSKKPIPPTGIRCPKCGRASLPAVYTRHRASTTVRVRKCKNPECGQRIRTVEKIESNAG